MGLSGNMLPARHASHSLGIAVAASGVAAITAIVIWQAAAGVPDPLAPGTSAGIAIFDIAVLVFREGLEAVLVLAAITANMTGPLRVHRRPVVAGVGVALVATLATWRAAVGIIDSLTDYVPALDVQALTGLFAILVLLVVMNWFFHKVYWTGWISAHTSRKQDLLDSAGDDATSKTRLFWGLGLLGFTSLYREGFEVVLFLQSYRLKLGDAPVLYGVILGSILSGIVAALMFVAHRRLPYRRMLVLTGIMLGAVLLVMVGEQAQEMQLAHWLPTTNILWLDGVIPAWMGLWFSVFPTIETLTAQLLAATLVLGSYLAARFRTHE